jgi:putative transposase/transposase-like zinc-binding protein/TrwC relaxase
MGRKTMILLSSIIEQFEPTFYRKYTNSILPSYKKALFFMKRCRKEHGLHMLAQCSDDNCGKRSYIPHSCGHRSCPHCQNHESSRWTENQLEKLLPAEYYLITFTLPKQLRKLAWRNQKLFYTLMFQSVQGVLKTFTANDKQLKGNAGFTTVLHTHSRRLDYHPHIHVVMTGGSIDPETRSWRTKTGKYLFNQKALAKVFRAVLLKAVVRHGLQVPKKCPHKWVVDCKNVGKGDKALIYLGTYLYKGVIREKDIIAYNETTVTFRYFHAQSKHYRTRTVLGEKFLLLVLQHVLPKGFRRVRSYGFLHPCSKGLIKLLQLILHVNPPKMYRQLQKRAAITCSSCGAKMKIVLTMIPATRVRRIEGFT